MGSSWRTALVVVIVVPTVFAVAAFAEIAYVFMTKPWMEGSKNPNNSTGEPADGTVDRDLTQAVGLVTGPTAYRRSVLDQCDTTGATARCRRQVTAYLGADGDAGWDQALLSAGWFADRSAPEHYTNAHGVSLTIRRTERPAVPEISSGFERGLVSAPDGTHSYPEQRAVDVLALAPDVYHRHRYLIAVTAWSWYT